MRFRILFIDPDEPAFNTLTEINGVPLKLEFYWLEKTRSWYLDIREEQAPTYLARGRRLAPRGYPYLEENILPQPFLLVVSGEDYAQRRDIGRKFEIAVIDQL